MCKKPCFTLPFNKQHGKWAQTLFKSEPPHLYHIYWSLGRQLSLGKSLLVICKILRVFANTFTTDDKNSLINRDNLTRPIPTQLSHKQKGFPQFVAAFAKCRLNFEHFWEKSDTRSQYICEITDSEKRDWIYD